MFVLTEDTLQGVDADRLKWYVEAELTNGRWVRTSRARKLFAVCTAAAPAGGEPLRNASPGLLREPPGRIALGG